MVARVTVTIDVAREVARQAFRMAARTDEEQEALENLCSKIDRVHGTGPERVGLWQQRARTTRVRVPEPISS